MAQVTVQGLAKAYSGQDLFTALSFELIPGMRLAVAGPNGCGKTTLLRILAGREDSDGGQVSLSKGARVGYVTQELDDTDLAQGLLGWVLSALPSWAEFWEEWERAVANDNESRLAQLSERQGEFERQYGYNPDHKARAILSGLGFSETDLLKSLGELSGGWRERAKLGRVLLQGADVLLLDEPTNHLDLEAVEWLEDYCRNFQGAMAFVAHDRVFLEKLGTHVLFISGGIHQMRKGTFSSFLQWEEENAERLSREAAKLSARIESEMGYIRRFRVKARKSAQAQSKLKKVEKLESELGKIKGEQRAAKPGRSLSFRLPEPARCDKVPVNCVDLEFHYDDGPSVWDKLSFQVFRGRKIALAAPNGAGKTTLLKILTGQMEPTGGHVKIGGNVSMGYFSQHQSEILRSGSTALGEIRRMSDSNLTEEQLKSVLGLFMLGESYFDRKVDALSGGEKNRLILAGLFLARANLLILDEPTNHLDLESRMGLVSALKDYEGTLFFVAHDRYLLSEVAEEIWELTNAGIEIHEGGFEAYDASRRARIAQCKAQSQDKGECESQQSARLSKEDKRRLAEARNTLYRRLKPLKDEYEKLEAKLESVLEEQSGVEEKLNDPEVYDKPEEALKLNKAYREASEYAEELLDRLGELEAQMEVVNTERKELGID